MATASSRQFRQKALCQRSFQRQDLRGVVFWGCDLRGCRFQEADLRAGVFENCQVGIAPRRFVITLIVLLLGALVMFHAVSTMLLSSIGTLPGSAAWPYVLALYVALAIAASGSGLQTLQLPVAHLAECFTGGATGALIGFFYGGTWTGNNSIVATISAVGMGFLGLLIAHQGDSPLIAAILGTLGAIAAYGLTFGLWTVASSYLTTGGWGLGLAWGLVAVFYLGVTVISGGYSVRSLRQFATTSFRKANLTNCTFIQTDLSQCDLRDSIGPFSP